MKKTSKILVFIIILTSFMLIAAAPLVQEKTPPPPAETTKLIFIHHSCGENWLSDDDGGLGMALAQNNYFVSDTYYGWGPDSIGDATDIPNWLDWFIGDESARYLDALYNESEPATSYSRPLGDPGGENEIILFKSCFPNSELEGNPNDSSNPNGWLTVGNSKHVYNTILEYFATRPDKLFIAITAPPVSDSAYAENARAFNNWLVDDWLKDYPDNNVAVFDFHAVLTGGNNHHRVSNGQIEHFTEAGMNTLYYPSDDDHPATRGNQKATGEFVPLLNLYVNWWQATAPPAPPVDVESAPVAESETPPESSSASPPSMGVIDDFEGDVPPNNYGWQAFKDDGGETKISCAPTEEMAYQGQRSMKIEYDIALYSWATCELDYENPQNWSDSEGISFSVQAAQEELFFNVDLFVENDQGTESYFYRVWLDTASEWQQIFIPWGQFKRVDWEENGGASFSKAEQISALAFGFNTPDDTEIAPVGVIYIDNLALGQSSTQPEASAPVPETISEPEEAPAEEPNDNPLPCIGSLLAPLSLVGFAFWQRRVV